MVLSHVLPSAIIFFQEPYIALFFTLQQSEINRYAYVCIYATCILLYGLCDYCHEFVSDLLGDIGQVISPYL